jgi:hypothetical protein
MSVDEWSCVSDPGVPQIRSISEDDVAAENCVSSGDDSPDDGHDKDEETEGSDGDLGGARAGTVLYIVDEGSGGWDGQQRNEGHVDKRGDRCKRALR